MTARENDAAAMLRVTQGKDMTDDWSLLHRSKFDLDTAVLFAELSALAYLSPAETKAGLLARGFDTCATFDAADVQGYWCSRADVALLAFRGTSNPGQWLRDVRFFPVGHPWGHVHTGFRDGVAAVESALAAFDNVAKKAANVWMIGHSLGGALALLAAARLKIKTGRAAALHTYGQPAVGLNDFAARCNVELAGTVWRFVNQSDIVARVPPSPLYRHVGAVKRIVRPGVLASMGGLIAAPLSPTVESAVATQQVIAGGAAREAARAATDSGIEQPLLTDLGPQQMSDTEFARLQLALNAGTPTDIQTMGLESLFPWFSDHAITEYIRLLTDIRKQSSAAG